MSLSDRERPEGFHRITSSAVAVTLFPASERPEGFQLSLMSAVAVEFPLTLISAVAIESLSTPGEHANTPERYGDDRD